MFLVPLILPVLQIIFMLMIPLIFCMIRIKHIRPHIHTYISYLPYFFLTLAVTLLVTFLLPIPCFIIFGDHIPPYVSALILLILCFVLMCGYGYAVIKAKRPLKPSSRAGIYMPLFLPLLWYLLNTGIWNLLDSIDTFSAALLGFWSLHLYGALLCEEGMLIPGLDMWHSILFWNLVYDSVLILGFAAGERLSAKKTGTERTPFAYHKKVIVAVLILTVAAYSLSEFVLFRKRENLVDSAYPSYNFSYAGGYSSIDLSPYSVENEENILAKLEEPADFIIIDPKQMPIMDGAEAAYPVYSAFANACYMNISEIQEKADESGPDAVDPIQFTNTIHAYKKLLSGEIDIFFGARPSEAQLAMADEAGVELTLTPIGKEAFVFFVNEQNPVDGLNSEQLRGIYSGQINNWRKVGGEDQKILAFQRPENSGSQTMMEYFMGDTPLRKPLETEYESSMGGTVRKIADYKNSASSLGYSFRYYTTIMMMESGEETSGIKLLAVDGVYPDAEAIRSGEYPYTTQLYAITVANRTDAKSTIEPFLEWMTGEQGQKIVADTGYVAVD